MTARSTYRYFEILFRTKMNMKTICVQFLSNETNEQNSEVENPTTKTRLNRPIYQQSICCRCSLQRSHNILYTSCCCCFVFSSFIFSFVDVTMYALRFSAFDFVREIQRDTSRTHTHIHKTVKKFGRIILRRKKNERRTTKQHSEQESLVDRSKG